MDLARIFRKPKLLRTLTTLDAGEFERLDPQEKASQAGTLPERESAQPLF